MSHLLIACTQGIQPRCLYRLAGLDVWTNCPLPLLPFAPSLAVETAAHYSGPSEIEHTSAPYVAVRAPLGGRVCTVSVARTPHGYHVDVEGVGAFWVNDAGDTIHADPASHGAVEDAIFTEALLGPPLMLAFALRDVWCLHAGSSLIGGKPAALAADSGTGKSTLARRLDELGMRRVADDILPITLTGGQVHAWPHFPQLKLPLDCQPSLGLPEHLPLHTLYQLDGSAPPDGDLTPQPLSARAAATALLRHTVAARLFDAGLLRRHLDFAAQAVRTLRVCRLPYPRRLEMLPAVAAALAADLAP